MIRATGRLLCWLAARLTHAQRLEASARRERQRAGEGLPPKVRAWLEGL